MTKFKLNENQIQYLENKQNKRYSGINNTILNPNNNLRMKFEQNHVEVNRKSIREQKEQIEQHINNVLSKNKIEFQDLSSIEFIDFMDKNYFRFDSLSGELMSMGWELEINNDKKMFLTGQSNLLIDDNQIARANKLSYQLFGMTLKDLLSQKFNVNADWKQFA